MENQASSVNKKKIRINFSNNKVDPAETNLLELIEVMRKVANTPSQAKANEISIGDNNGGRIYL